MILEQTQSKIPVEQIKNLILADNFKMSVRLLNLLKNWNIQTLYDLTCKSENGSSYGLVHNPIPYELVKSILEPLELKLGMTDADWAEWEKNHKDFDIENLKKSKEQLHAL